MPRNTQASTTTDWGIVGISLLECTLAVGCVGFGLWGTPVLGFSIVLIALGVVFAWAGYVTFRLGRSIDPDYVSPEEQEARLAANWQERLHRIGPDLEDDVRLGRPYFLLCVDRPPGRAGRGVPLNVREDAELAFAGNIRTTHPELARALGRVRTWVAARHDEGRGSITDVYVLSHGWHRNLYGSVAAYDRLISRLQSLQRSVLSAPDNYHPLFLAVHWHSDPGENQWRDSSGRRSKASFMRNVRATFEGAGKDFECDFEALHELFATMSQGLSSEQKEERKTHDVTMQRINEIVSTFHDLRDSEARALLDAHKILGKRLDPLAADSTRMLDRLRDPAKQYRLKSTTVASGGPWTVEDTAAAWAGYHSAAPEDNPRDPEKARGGIFGAWRRLRHPAVTLAVVTAGLLTLLVITGDVRRLLPLWLITHFQSQPDIWDARSNPLLSVFFFTAWSLVAHGFNYASARWKRVPARDVDPDAPADGWRDEERQQAISQRRDRLVAPLVLLLYGTAIAYFAILALFYSPTLAAALTAFVTCAALYLAGGGIAQKVRLSHDDHADLLKPRTWGESLSRVPVAVFAVPHLQMATWVVVQSLFSLPLLLYTLATRLLGAVFNWRGRSEQSLHRTPDQRSVDLRPKHLLSLAAALPIKVARTALPVDSRFHYLLDTVEAQLAFWQMQRRAVETGVTMGQALARLLQATRGFESARIHFLGHSFGGLVAAHAAKQFMFEGIHTSDNEKPLGSTMESLTLLLPAMTSHWFEKEEHLQKAIRGTIACLHSRRDTANGFFYPLANHGQRSAGFSGLAGIDPVTSSTARSADSFPRLVNRDLSDVCCDGPRFAGGGHGDIFKDKVLRVVWEEINARPVTAP